jgi:hypothetical protein
MKERSIRRTCIDFWPVLLPNGTSSHSWQIFDEEKENEKIRRRWEIFSHSFANSYGCKSTWRNKHIVLIVVVCVNFSFWQQVCLPTSQKKISRKKRRKFSTTISVFCHIHHLQTVGSDQQVPFFVEKICWHHHFAKMISYTPMVRSAKCHCAMIDLLDRLCRAHYMHILSFSSNSDPFPIYSVHCQDFPWRYSVYARVRYCLVCRPIFSTEAWPIALSMQDSFDIYIYFPSNNFNIRIIFFGQKGWGIECFFRFLVVQNQPRASSLPFLSFRYLFSRSVTNIRLLQSQNFHSYFGLSLHLPPSRPSPRHSLARRCIIHSICIVFLTHGLKEARECHSSFRTCTYEASFSPPQRIAICLLLLIDTTHNIAAWSTTVEISSIEDRHSLSIFELIMLMQNQQWSGMLLLESRSNLV